MKCFTDPLNPSFQEVVSMDEKTLVIQVCIMGGVVPFVRDPTEATSQSLFICSGDACYERGQQEIAIAVLHLATVPHCPRWPFSPRKRDHQCMQGGNRLSCGKLPLAADQGQRFDERLHVVMPHNRICHELSRIFRIGTDDSEYGNLETASAPASSISNVSRHKSWLMVCLLTPTGY
jgi:hypothetical protein